MGKLEKKLKKNRREFDAAERYSDKQIDKTLAKILANKKISAKRARKLFKAQDEVDRLSARVERLEFKLAKKKAKANRRELIRSIEDAAEGVEQKVCTGDPADSSAASTKEAQAGVAQSSSSAAHQAAKEQAARELSEFAYKPTRGALPNPSNPYSQGNFDYLSALLQKRVKASRYEHSLAVSETAAKLAQAYGLDVPQARIAGLLHDWDKALDHEHLVRRITDFNLDISAQIVAGMPYVLHGPTAAAVLRKRFPELRPAVFSAIEKHTLGSPNMSALEMVVMVADKIEPGHDVAAYRDLYDQIGVLPLEDLFFQVLKLGLVYVLDSAKPFSQESVDVWNYYVEKLI
ncbi:MAG: bis(5'-nucleosyl)-tetraphosphatase (symmetrical) YqeK [Coriobacteriia bacterium]|nr:bis(5'-nucleosyl)-tetraphosphatase (symmetrical) YqeK [Coriobacteriia bacterium]